MKDTDTSWWRYLGRLFGGLAGSMFVVWAMEITPEKAGGMAFISLVATCVCIVADAIGGEP